MTKQQERFVIALLANKGKNKKAAAIAAGYSPKSAGQTASDLLNPDKNPEVCAFYERQKNRILSEVRAQFLYEASGAIKVLVDIMHDKDADNKDRRAAADSILDRAGFKPVDKQKQEITGGLAVTLEVDDDI